jgi:hypothetical protein
MVPFLKPKVDQQTLRITNLAPLVSRSDIEQFFQSRVTARHGEARIVENVGHIYTPVNLDTKTAIVTFSYSVARKAFELDGREFRPANAQLNDPAGRSQIRIDRNFLGATTIYEPPTRNQVNLE